MHKKSIVWSGKPVRNTDKALIMLHGRGGSADDILSIETEFHLRDFAVLAPEATGNTWYPYSFLEPVQKNEPWLSSALQLIAATVQELNEAGLNSEMIYFLGFSQGACLALEFTARNARKYGGVIAFTGGLIGDILEYDRYQGDFDRTPVFLGTSDPDPHVPLERAKSTAILFQEMNADTTLKIYSNMGHTINQDEIDTVNQIFFTS